MILHNEREVFIEFIQKASDDLGIQDIYIEKDYWVTYALKQLSVWDTKKEVVFKGGTSLSKAFNIVDRFSEDVDLVLKDTSASSNQIKKKLKQVHDESVKEPLLEVESPRNSKGTRFRKIDYSYPQLLDDYEGIGDASDKLLVELNSFGNPFPVVTRSMNSYIAEMLNQNNRQELVQKYQLENFNLEVLDYRRTFSEKLMAIFRVCLKDNYLEELRARVRHFYDIAKLLNVKEVENYLASENHLEVLKEIYNNDLNTPEFGKDWTATDLSQNNIFIKFEEILGFIEPHFESQFRAFLYSREKFDFDEINKSFEQIKKELGSFDLSSAK